MSTQLKRRTLLFVAMQMSTHTVRWINQIVDQGWDIHLFPVNAVPMHSELRNVTLHQPWIVLAPRLLFKNILDRRLFGTQSNKVPSRTQVAIRSIFPVPMLEGVARILNGILRVRLGESEATAPLAYGPHVLAYLVRKLQPDLIHSLEFQHCGYTVLKAKEIFGEGFPEWLATNWGSDIYYYRQFEDHRRQISRLLRSADYYSCECVRDVGLAKELGLTAKVMPVMPNSGGFNVPEILNLRVKHPPSRRKLVMVKGYQHFAGRALTALDAVERCAAKLNGYQVIIFSASPEIFERVKTLREHVGINISILAHTNHDSMLRMFSQARVYLGVSVSDAISTSMLEALALGTFPIQTNTSCCNEWIEHGKSGFEIPADDAEVIASCLKRALDDDDLVEKAAALNWITVQERLDQRMLREKARALYQAIFGEEN